MMRLRTVFQDTVTADASTRQISGLAVPFEVKSSNTSHGVLTIKAGAIRMPRDLKRIKLLRDHDRAAPVGYAVAAEERADGLYMTFQTADTPGGQTALVEASEGVRDGMSVELDHPVIRNGELISGDLVAVAQCAVPAWTDARFTVAASDAGVPVQLTDTPLPVGPPPLDPVHSHADDVECDDDCPAYTTDDPPPADPPTDPPAAPPADPSGETVQTVTAQQVGPGAVAPPAQPTFAAACRMMADASRGRTDWATVRAALTDIVPANDTTGNGAMIGRPAWIGELWSATTDVRTIVDLFTKQPLDPTGLTIWGWRWLTRPGGAKYTGNKTDVASRGATWGPVSTGVLRWAGANDIDRVFFDRGDPGFRDAYYRALLSDYMLDTEADFVAAVVAAATPTTSTATTLAGLIVDEAIRLAGIGAQLNSVAVAADVFASEFGITNLEAPWLLSGSASALNLGGQLGINLGGVQIRPSVSLTPGQVVLGDKRAAIFYEESTPIRVETVNIPQGGIDLGMFGYYGYLFPEPLALREATIDVTP